VVLHCKRPVLALQLLRPVSQVLYLTGHALDALLCVTQGAHDVCLGAAAGAGAGADANRASCCYSWCWLLVLLVCMGPLLRGLTWSAGAARGGVLVLLKHGGNKRHMYAAFLASTPDRHQVCISTSSCVISLPSLHPANTYSRSAAAVLHHHRKALTLQNLNA
jgi:hypothetical protein